MRNLIVFCVLAFVAHVADAGDCTGFRWPVTSELQLFAGPAADAAAGHDGETVPLLQVDRLYRLALSEQESVRLPVAPSKPMLTDGAYAGVVRFAIATEGNYRVALDTGFWVDVVHAGAPLPSADFSGSVDCPGPRKIVEYRIEAPGEYLVQLSAVTAPVVRLAITAVP